MVEYSRIGLRVCDSFSTSTFSKPDRANDTKDLLSYFLYQLEQWQKSIPDDLQFSHHDFGSVRRSRLIRSLLYLRGNQLKIVIMRPFLCSKAGSKIDTKLWPAAVHAACDTIQVLSHIHRTSDEYQFQLSYFNYFFVSALGIVMLIASRAALEARLSSFVDLKDHQLAAAEQSTYKNARRGILIALNLLRMLMADPRSPRSSCRMWNTILNLGYRIHVLGISDTEPEQLGIGSSAMDNVSSSFHDDVEDDTGNDPWNLPWDNNQGINADIFADFEHEIGTEWDWPLV
jgi:hypothetical protein